MASNNRQQNQRGVPQSNPRDNGTRLDTHIDAPSITQPGDGPADTMDPTEHATSVSGDKAAAALAGHGTVNAAVPVEPTRKPTVRDTSKDRVETYERATPDGKTVKVTHNLDSGETSTAPVGASSAGAASAKSTGD